MYRHSRGRAHGGEHNAPLTVPDHPLPAHGASRFPRIASRRSRERRPGPPSGITLIELLVVVALLAVLAAVALPNFERLTAVLTLETQREHILNQFAGLGATAMLHGRDYVVVGSDADDPDDVEKAALVGRTRYELDVPDGWAVLVEEPILIRASGVCLGGLVTLLHEEQEAIHVELEAPFCRVDAS